MCVVNVGGGYGLFDIGVTDFVDAFACNKAEKMLPGLRQEKDDVWGGLGRE